MGLFPLVASGNGVGSRYSIEHLVDGFGGGDYDSGDSCGCVTCF